MIKLNAEQMEDSLDQYLDPVLSFRRSAAGPAEQIAKLSATEQQFALHWVEIIAATNAEMAYQFSANFSTAVKSLKHQLDAVEQWIIKAMTAFDDRGLQLANKVLVNSSEFADNYFKKQYGIELDKVKKLLTTFVCGLNGRELKIEAAEYSYTDTETIYLPQLIADFSSKEDNFLYYKLLTVYLWAQNWCGSWHYDLDEICNRYNNPKRAMKLFHSIETIRLLHCIGYELSGFYRQISCFLDEFNLLLQQPQWQSIYSVLANKGTTIDDSLRLLDENYSFLEINRFHFQGLLFPNKVQQIKLKRILDEKTRFREALSHITDEKRKTKSLLPDSENSEINEPKGDFTFKPIIETDFSSATKFQLELDGQIIIPTQEIQSLISSIIQDLGEIPPDYLHAAGPGKYSLDNQPNNKVKNDVWSGVYHEEGAYFYDEWDYIRQRYRKNWCVVRELKITPVHDDFIQQTLLQYKGVVKSLRRNFEALKAEEKILKRQFNGDDIDIDAVVESYADLTMGMELSERVFTQMQREERNIAVMFMVDMSGSTKGWINQAEREALLLLCESLQLLGDRYAIYGFSGTTRKRCEIYHIKHFNEDYNDKVKARISGISAKDYTRMGFAIRHLGSLLEQIEAKTKLLITLSDGKPEDYDGQYRGQYGIEDTRQALFEVRKKGIHPYCITIDKEAGDYLAHMYGAVNYSLIEDISKLPLKVSEIYRKLTS